jgi:WD40 repeat protein
MEAPSAELRAIHHFGRVQALAFSSDGRLLLSATDDGKVRLSDPQTLKSRGDLSSEGAGAPTCMAVRAGDGQLAIGCGNRVLFVDLRGR